MTPCGWPVRWLHAPIRPLSSLRSTASWARLTVAVACGAESTQHFGAGILDPGRVERLLGEVNAEQLELRAEIG